MGNGRLDPTEFNGGSLDCEAINGTMNMTKLISTEFEVAYNRLLACCTVTEIVNDRIKPGRANSLSYVYGCL